MDDWVTQVMQAVKQHHLLPFRDHLTWTVDGEALVLRYEHTPLTTQSQPLPLAFQPLLLAAFTQQDRFTQLLTSQQFTLHPQTDHIRVTHQPPPTTPPEDPVVAKLATLVRKLRGEEGQHIELEARIGFFTTAGEFEPGLSNEFKDVVPKMRQALSQTFALHEQRQYWRGYYPNNIRQTSFQKTSPTEYTLHHKTVMERLDLEGNYPIKVRVALAQETPFKLEEADLATQDMVRREQPEGMRAYHRQSFMEFVSRDTTQLPFDVTFRYDISRVSAWVKQKRDVHQQPCRYHLEVECQGPLPEKGTPEEDVCVAQLFLDRMRRLVGQHPSLGIPRFFPR